MKAVLKRVLLTLAELLRDAAGIVLMLLTAALAFLLFTESGAVLALRAVERATGTLAIDGIEGRLWGELRLQRLYYDDDSVQVNAEGIELNWSPQALLSRQLRVSRLHAQALRIEVRPSAPQAAAPASETLSELPLAVLLGDVQLGRLQLLLPESTPLLLKDIVLSADWRGREVDLRKLAVLTPWVGAVELAGRARLRGDAAEIERLTVSGFVQARLHGVLGYTDTASDLQLAWQQLQWPLQGEPLLHSDRGQLHWQGHFDDYRYALSTGLRAAEHSMQIKASGSGSLEGLGADVVAAELLGGSMEGTLALNWRDELLVNAELRVSGLDPSQLDPRVKGELNGAVNIRTQLEREGPRIDFGLDLAESTLHGYPLRLNARGRYFKETLELASLDLRSGASRLRGKGQVWPRLDASANLESSNLASLWPDVYGRATIKLVARGEYALPSIDATARITELRYGDVRLASADLDARVDLQRSLAITLTARGLHAGADVRQLRLRVHGPLNDHRIELGATATQGSVRAVAQGLLDPLARRWRGQLLDGTLAPEHLAAWTLEAPAAVRLGPGIDLEPACWASGTARACIRVLSDQGAQRLAFRLESFELGSLAPLLPTGTVLQAVLSGNGVVAWDDAGLHQLRAELFSSAGKLQQAGLPPLRWQAAQLLAEESARGAELRLNLPFEQGVIDMEALLAGEGDLMRRSLSGHLRVVLPDLGFARALSRELRDVEGRLDGEWALAGTLAQPQPQGALVLSGGHVRLVTPGIELHELQARIEANGAEPLSVQASARSGEGELRLGGTVNPWVQPLRLELALQGDQVQVLHTPEASVWASPDLKLVLAEQQLRVSGTLVVPRAEIAPKSLSSGVSASADQVIVEQGSEPDAGLGIYADLQLRLGKDVRFEGFGLKTRLAGALQLREQPGIPASARGEINLLEGRYKAYGQDLNIETGRLLFTGGAVTTPAVELRATRKPRSDITVGVLVRGSLAKPELSLFSTPTMSQQQQLSWLILGRDIEQSTGAEDREMLAGAALSMGLAGGEWLAQRFGGAIGLDQIALGAKPGESAERAQLTVGKYLAPGLFISYGIGLFQPGHSFKLEYDIGHGFKLATESGVESGGDLLYTIEPEARLNAPASLEPAASVE